jgi:hypothetical protein
MSRQQLQFLMYEEMRIYRPSSPILRWHAPTTQSARGGGGAFNSFSAFGSSGALGHRGESKVGGRRDSVDEDENDDDGEVRLTILTRAYE